MSEFSPLNTCDGAFFPDGKATFPDTSLSVRITALCDNDCSFCIAAEDMKHRHSFDLEKVVANTLASGAKNISLIGGEPLLFLDSCIAFVEAIREQVSVIYLTTSLPRTMEVQWDKYVELQRLVDFTTVSIQSMDWEQNNELMDSKQNYDRISVLRRVLATEDFADRVTVNLNLVVGGVDTREKFMATFFALKDLGVKKLRINEVMRAPESYVNFEDMLGVELGSPYSAGCKTVLELDPTMDVMLKRSCFMVERSLQASEADLRKLEEKIAEPERFVSPGWRVLYEHGEYAHTWKHDRKSLPIVEVS